MLVMGMRHSKRIIARMRLRIEYSPGIARGDEAKFHKHRPNHPNPKPRRHQQALHH
jgi:hypothetical protein